MSAKWQIRWAMLVLAVLGSLIFAGVQLGSNWDTFVPDMIIGLVGAGIISGVIAFGQNRAEQQRGIADRVTAAYDGVIDALSPLRTTQRIDSETFDQLGKVHSLLVRLAENSNDNLVFEWFEAERQFSIQCIAEATRRLDQLPSPAPRGAEFKARSIFNGWASAFAENLRYWRAGLMVRAEMVQHTSEVLTTVHPGLAWSDKWPDDRKDNAPK